MAKRPDYDTCKTCTHTSNIHDPETFDCNAYLCRCDAYAEGKK